MRRNSKTQIVKTRWLRLTEASNALDYLKQAQYYIAQVDHNTTDWKWIIISLHGALYGFMVCAVIGPDARSSTYTKEVGPKGNKKTIRLLISFNELLRRCRQASPKLIWFGRSHLTVTPQQMKSIQELHEDFRHNFEHFQPKGWSIEVHDTPDVCLDVVEVMRVFLLDLNIVRLFNLTQKEKKQVSSCLFQCSRLLKKTRMYREHQAIKTGKARWGKRRTRSNVVHAAGGKLRHD